MAAPRWARRGTVSSWCFPPHLRRAAPRPRGSAPLPPIPRPPGGRGGGGAGVLPGAAAQAQRDLAAYPWPAGESVRVRIGIHTGSPAPYDGGYVGIDVHRAARISGATHGGQVVISAATAELVRGRLPEGVRLLDLGSHHLKDLPL